MEIQTQSNLVPLSKNVKTEGFDLQAGLTWIYPTNYPTRDYQFNIISAALLKNTLVSLPTGLGKTFIAAVIMYNFYRWYPQGKIIFMAPTRPLVKQQIDACYNIMAIPEEVTAELTGTKASTSRSEIWLQKRVFFVTPQVLQNDLDKVAKLGQQIKCLVFDEAHKARGNHAYCQVIRQLLENNHKNFRVLALSATPGSNIDDVSEVVHNLLIAHLEFRTEESLDVKPYVFERSLETVVVHLDDKLIEVKEQYMKIVEYYAKTLMKFNIIRGNCGSLTKGKIFMLMKDFQSKNRGSNSSNYSEIMRCLNMCVTLYHALELLIRHGLRNFLSFFDEHIERPLLKSNSNLRAIVENVRGYLGPIPQIEVLPDGTYPEIPSNIKFGHPKHYKLREILSNHFSGENRENTRVIVFFEYRESVMEAHTLLLQSRPLIRPRVFLGQGSGITQKTQLGVVNAFKEGKCNTLLSTCIGEEGLDVGEVDLIVCFDISNKSPIRMVQRMGRTGRKRAGNVLVLVTEGKEQQTLKDCLIHKNNIAMHVLGSSMLKNNLYPYNPRMVPADLVPRCEKLFITVKAKAKKNLLKNKRSSSEIIFSQNSEEMQRRDIIPATNMISFAENPLQVSKSPCVFNRHIEKMRVAQKANFIQRSDQTAIFTDLLCYADSKRFNIPTRTHGHVEERNLKQGDIRTMFCTSREKGVVIVDSQYSQKSDPPSDESDLILDNIFKFLSDYLIDDLWTLKCRHCPENFNCSNFALDCTRIDNSEGSILIPSQSILDEITFEDIEDAIIAKDASYFTRASSKLENNKFEAPDSFIKVLDKLGEKNFEDDLLAFFKLNSYKDIFEGNSFSNTIQEESEILENIDISLLEKQHNGLDINKSSSPSKTIDLGDLCDLSYFGLSNIELSNNNSKHNQSSKNIFTQIIDLVDQQQSPEQEKIANPKLNKIRPNKKKHNEFLEVEAEVEDDELFSEDEDENCNDSFEKSFVNDATQITNTETYGMYLRSIRSPSVKPFRRPAPILNLSDVYSQVPLTQENDYVQDSFCVSSDEEEEVQSQYSMLEILENKLLKQKRKKKQENADSRQLKRRRIKYVPTEDSD